MIGFFADLWRYWRARRFVKNMQPGVYSVGIGDSVAGLPVRRSATMNVKPEVADTAQEMADKRIPANLMGRDWIIERVFTVGSEVKCDVVEYDASIFDWEAPDAVEASHIIGYRRD